MARRWTSVAVLVVSCAVHSASAELSFYWWFGTQNDFTIPQCSTLTVGFQVNPNATVQPVPPYYLISYAVGSIPSVFYAGTGANWDWNVNYPSGTKLLMSFVDSQGNSGGVGPIYTVTNGRTNCPTYAAPASPVSFTANPNSMPSMCQNMDISISGGTPPYVLSFISAGDTTRNTTFNNGTGSARNVLSAGATFILSVSDSAGVAGNTTQLISSGGGGDTSCLIPTETGKPDINGNGHHKISPAAAGGIAAAIGAAIIAGIFFYYRRRNARQRKELLQARAAATSGGPNEFPGAAYGLNGREKKLSPGFGGGMWRPESPVEYPGFAHAPVRFRVTNPDDEDARSQFSPDGVRSSDDTLRGTPRRKRFSDEPSALPNTPGRQRRSLMQADHNALYPPRGSHFSATTQSTDSLERPRGLSLSTDVDGGWPTFSSASSTDDHYTDVPASSAGILSAGSTAVGTGSSKQTWRQVEPDEMDVEEMYTTDGDWEEDGRATPTSDAKSIAARTHKSSGSVRSNSNAQGSPFADANAAR